MTKEQKADALLCAAKHWQVGDVAPSGILDVFWTDLLGGWLTLFNLEAIPQEPWIGWGRIVASAALSEVCHYMGYELEDDK